MAKREQPDVLARLVGADGKIEPCKIVSTATQLMRLGMLRMNRVQDPFIRIKNKYGRTPRRRILKPGEKCGKTRISVCESIAHAMGFRPWLRLDDSDYKISIRVPNQGFMGCQTMAQSVSAKIEPELAMLIPAHCAPDWKRDTTGALKSVTLKYDYLGRACGSTLHVRSYNQLADTFLGIDYDHYGWDEPPPYDLLIAAERGKVTTNVQTVRIPFLVRPPLFDVVDREARPARVAPRLPSPPLRLYPLCLPPGPGAMPAFNHLAKEVQFLHRVSFTEYNSISKEELVKILEEFDAQLVQLRYVIDEENDIAQKYKKENEESLYEGKRYLWDQFKFNIKNNILWIEDKPDFRDVIFRDIFVPYEYKVNDEIAISNHWC